MAKQACSAYLLCKGHELDTVIQHLMYLFLLGISCSYGTSGKDCDKCSKQRLYTPVKVVMLCVCFGKKILLILLNKFKLVFFYFLLQCSIFHFMLK